MRISALKCYALAWKGFAKWWIPLCLVSGAIFLFNLLPQILAAPDMQKLMGATGDVLAAAGQDLDTLAAASERMNRQLWEMLVPLARITLYIFPAVALFTVILLMFANRAVKDSRKKDNSWPWLAYVSLVHVILALGKAAAFCLLFVPGAYLYIKLMFVPLVMMEQKKDPFAAIAESWRMTQGNFWSLTLLILMNATVQLVAMSTVIGIIPATAFANTARAAAFRMLLDNEPPVLMPVDAQ